MSRRTLVFVLGLTVGDYLLWSWSLNGNHDAIALASGLTLPPLALASLWLLAVGAAKLIALTARQPSKLRRTPGSNPADERSGSQAKARAGEDPTAQPAPSRPSPGKIAA